MAYNRCIGTRTARITVRTRSAGSLSRLQQASAGRPQGTVLSDAAHAQDGRKWDLMSWFKAPDASGMREEDEWDLIKMAKTGRDGAHARRDGKMHLLHATHRAGENRAEVKAALRTTCGSRKPPARSPRRLPAGVSGGRDCVRRHQRSGQQRFAAQGTAAELFRARDLLTKRARHIWRASAIRTRTCGFPRMALQL